ncbi:MAG: phosphoribosylamine--glycine ligase [Deltaproteobacteria bacterium]|nr:phosphoribosylamine--glycine ligase [Deltaproteobacteria bacterium]
MNGRTSGEVLVIGSGGREHALACALARSSRVRRVLVCPGNGGTTALPSADGASIEAVAAPLSGAGDLAPLIALARDRRVALTVVGPEAPLAAGIVDAFGAAGLRCFGPTAACARIESSKAWAKALMARAGVPTPRCQVFDDYTSAREHLRRVDHPVVIKASGLAAGKGVALPEDLEQAEQALIQIMVERRHGAAGDRVLIEERVAGIEVSMLALCDGRRARLLPAAQDHKRLDDGDRGPNTGGMGACAPVAVVTPELRCAVEQRVFQPVLDLLQAEGTPYVGVLYAGLMLTAAGPQVLEFNCRFGDPEAQVLLPLLAGDLVAAIDACLDGALAPEHVRCTGQAAAAVVLAASGYPGSPRRGDAIEGVAAAARIEGVTVFHSGTARRAGELVTDGGRVLSVTGVGSDLARALDRAYRGAACIRFTGMQYRRDIGVRAGQGGPCERAPAPDRAARESTPRTTMG